MSDSPSLFDQPPPSELAARDAAIEQAGEHADEQWLAAARSALRLVAGVRTYLTSDDLLPYIPDGVTTHEPRAMGHVMLWGARTGLIRKTGRVVPTAVEGRHAGNNRVWESLVCTNPNAEPSDRELAGHLRSLADRPHLVNWRRYLLLAADRLS